MPNERGHSRGATRIGKGRRKKLLDAALLIPGQHRVSKVFEKPLFHALPCPNHDRPYADNFRIKRLEEFATILAKCILQTPTLRFDTAEQQRWLGSSNFIDFHTHIVPVSIDFLFRCDVLHAGFLHNLA